MHKDGDYDSVEVEIASNRPWPTGQLDIDSNLSQSGDMMLAKVEGASLLWVKR